jgi:cytochrome c biogenesis protein CcdA/thiol-disulfide isomerase/thioredoxin
MEAVSIGFSASVFGAGLLSFFSPCVLPLLPVYVGYISTDSRTENIPIYKKLVNVLAFIAGLSTVFFLLGFSVGALGGIIANRYFYIACGIIVLIFGLHQSGLINIPLLNRTYSINSKGAKYRGPLGAFSLGLVFSFGWTPCVGPILGSVLSLSARQGSAVIGGGLLLIYSLGLSVPFLVFTLGSGIFIKKAAKLHRHLPKIKTVGGVLIAAVGLYMILSQTNALGVGNSVAPVETGKGVNFTLPDIDGNTVNLSDYRGKPVFIKLWGTWCPSCLAGLEEFSAVANEYNKGGKLRVLSIVAPGLFGEMNEQGFTEWAKGQRLSFPILFDSLGRVNRQFYIRAYPTYVFIDRNGEVLETRIGGMGKAELTSKLKSMLAQ